MRRIPSEVVLSLTLLLALFLATPAWPQSGNLGTDIGGQSQMSLPPPVSNEAYPVTTGSEARSNYLGVGATFSGGFVHNLYPGSGSVPVDDTTYLIQPHISLDRAGPLYHATLTYTPSFTFYQPTSTLNSIDQSAGINSRLRLSPHVSLQAMDSFNKTSNAFVQNSSLSQGSVYGTAPSTTPGIVAPFAPQWTNNANAGIFWQFGANSMVSATGTLTQLNFTNPSQAGGFYNSQSRGGSGSYTHRISDRQDLGALYQYAWIHATPVGTSALASSVLQTNAILGFYTFYPSQQFSVSLTGGFQSYTATQSPLPTFKSRAPAGTISIGWQGVHTSFAASYGRAITSGAGVIGAYESDSANLSARWRLSRTWTAGVAGIYSEINSVTPKQFYGSTTGGHTISGSASLNYTIDRNLGLSCSYSRLHQTYSGLPAVSNNPNSDQVLVSLDYRLSRQLGR